MKIKQLYNLAAFQNFLDSGQALAAAGGKPVPALAAQGFVDALPGVVLARQLTYVDPKIFEVQYPELTFASSGIEGDNSGGFARQIQSRRRRPTGSFKTAGDRSSNRGKISITGEESSIPVVAREAGSEWSDDDVGEAALENVNLVEAFLTGTNEIYMQEVDEIGYLGIADKGTDGLLTYSGFTADAAGGAIGTLTAQQKYDAIASLITDQHNGVNNTAAYMATRVDMPVYVLNDLSVTILNTAAGPASVLSALKANFPGVQFRGTFRADDAGGVGVSHTVAYAPSRNAMVMRIPQPLTIGEIVRKGSFNHAVDYKYRIAGLDVLEDSAGRLLTGL